VCMTELQIFEKHILYRK